MQKTITITNAIVYIFSSSISAAKEKKQTKNICSFLHLWILLFALSVTGECTFFFLLDFDANTATRSLCTRCKIIYNNLQSAPSVFQKKEEKKQEIRIFSCIFVMLTYATSMPSSIQMHATHYETQTTWSGQPLSRPNPSKWMKFMQNCVVGKSIAIWRAHVATKVYICQTNENFYIPFAVCLFFSTFTHINFVCLIEHRHWHCVRIGRLKKKRNKSPRSNIWLCKYYEQF